MRLQIRDNVTLHFFDGHGQPLLRRHHENGRAQASVVDKYTANVLEHGLVQGVRGNAWGVENDDGTIALITYGTLASAVYEAHAKAPSNQFVIQALENGITGAVIFSNRMPQDCIRFLRDYHNSFHGGSKYSLMELYAAPLLVLVACVCDFCCACVCQVCFCCPPAYVRSRRQHS